MIRALIFVLFTTPAFAAEWQPKQVLKTYDITGVTPIELYTSIGENGPVIGEGKRTIATTVWDLKWRRNYQPEGSACVLKSALPFLTVMTSLPKPNAKLSGETAQRWSAFVDGIARHEKLHGADIVAMTKQIIADTVGLRSENDADCKAIRGEVLKRVQKAAEDYKAKSHAFDQVEMGDGGRVQQLILAFVNP